MKAGKLFALVIALALALTAVAIAEEEATEIVFPLEEPIEVSVYVCTGDSSYSLEETAIYQWMEEQTNVHLNVVYSTNLTENTEKLNIVMNTGDYPDILFKSGISPDQLLELGSEGVILQLDDLLQYVPNYCAIIDERGDWPAVTSSDGHIYSLFEISKPNVGNTPHMWINQQWLDNLGLEMPTNVDELYAVLKAFKDEDADGDGDPDNEIPWIASSDITPVEDILPLFGFNMQGWWDPWVVSEDGNSIEFFPATERYKEVLAFITQCYEEGLLYKDSFSVTNEQVCAMGQTGEAIGMFGQWHPGNTVGYYDKSRSLEENVITQYVAMIPFEGAKWPTAGGLNRGGLAITDKCEYPEIMMAWANLLYSEEGARVANYGFEGDTYDLVDGQVKMRDKDNPSETWGENVDHARLQMGGGTFASIPTYTELETYYDLEADPTARLLEDTYDLFEELDKFYPAWPALALTEEEAEVNADINADIDAYRLSYRAEVITGQTNLEDSWDAYIETLNNMGLQTAVDNMNAAYARYLGAAE